MTYHIIFSDETMPKEITKSIFLAGPSPRASDVYDWRHTALDILNFNNFDGTVFIPIPRNKFYGADKDESSWTYDNQIEWECKARDIADIIVFWVARDIKNKMPGFTTNVEFGEDLHSNKIVYGRPINAEKCKYLDQRMKEIKEPIFNKLTECIAHALDKLGNGALRTHGEVYIPLFIWNTNQFQNWYKQLKDNGNVLVKSKLNYLFKTKSNHIFAFILQLNIWVDAERRYKSNEFVFFRTDTSSVVPYYEQNNETFIVLVKEFRSSVRNSKGLVYELPSGSTFNKMTNPLENAQKELLEETGISINDLERFEFVSQRQVASSTSAHHSSLYKVRLSDEEFAQVKKLTDSNAVLGLSNEGEQIYLEIISLKNLMNYPLDYSMLGMILSSFRR